MLQFQGHFSKIQKQCPSKVSYFEDLDEHFFVVLCAMLASVMAHLPVNNVFVYLRLQKGLIVMRLATRAPAPFLAVVKSGPLNHNGTWGSINRSVGNNFWNIKISYTKLL